MTIYYYLISFILLSTVIYKCFIMYNIKTLKFILKTVKEIKIDNILLLLCFIMFFLILSFRNYDVGTDYKQYLIRFIEIGRTPFEMLTQVSDRFSFEYGFTLFNKVVYFLTQDPVAFSMLIAFFICFGFYIFIKNNSNDKLFSFFIFICYCIGTNAMNTMRQYMSIALLLLTLKFIIDKKFMKYFISILFATSFHTSSIVFLLLYPFNLIKKINLQYVLVILASAFMIALFGDKLFYPLIEKTSFAWYLVQGSGTGFNMLLFLIAVFIFIVTYSGDDFKKNPKYSLLIHMLSLSILLNACAIHLGVFERMMRSFTPALLILIPNCIYSRVNYRVNKIIIVLTYIFFIIYFSYMMRDASSSGNTNEYIFLDMDDFNREIKELHFHYYH